MVQCNIHRQRLEQFALHQDDIGIELGFCLLITLGCMHPLFLSSICIYKITEITSQIRTSGLLGWAENRELADIPTCAIRHIEWLRDEN